MMLPVEVWRAAILASQGDFEIFLLCIFVFGVWNLCGIHSSTLLELLNSLCFVMGYAFVRTGRKTKTISVLNVSNQTQDVEGGGRERVRDRLPTAGTKMSVMKEFRQPMSRKIRHTGGGGENNIRAVMTFLCS